MLAKDHLEAVKSSLAQLRDQQGRTSTVKDMVMDIMVTVVTVT